MKAKNTLSISTRLVSVSNDRFLLFRPILPPPPTTSPGTRAASSLNPYAGSWDRRDGGGGRGEDMKRQCVPNHYVNQHQERESHRFRSTDRLLESSPSSPSIYAGHHQCHLQQQQQSSPRSAILTSNPRPRGCIVTATAATTGVSPARYVLRTLSATPPEFPEHQRSYRETAAVLHTGSLQRNHGVISERSAHRRSSLISSLISSFTNPHQHLRQLNLPDQAASWTLEQDFADPSLEMIERRTAGGNRVVTFDLPPTSPAGKSSSLLSSSLHPANPAAVRRYSLSPLMPTSSSTSCLIVDSPEHTNLQTNLQKQSAVIGSSPSHYQTTAAYATLRSGPGKAALTSNPLLDYDPHQRNLCQSAAGGVVAATSSMLLSNEQRICLPDRLTRGQLYIDQSAPAQRSAVQEKRALSKNQITNSTANPLLFADSEAVHRVPSCGQQRHSSLFTSEPASSSSSSRMLQNADHQGQQDQQQEEKMGIKYSPDEGLGDERSEFEVAAGAASSAHAIIG